MRIPVLIRCDGTGPGRSDDGNPVEPAQPRHWPFRPGRWTKPVSSGPEANTSGGVGTICSPGKDRHEVRPVQSGLIEIWHRPYLGWSTPRSIRTRHDLR